MIQYGSAEITYKPVFKLQNNWQTLKQIRLDNASKTFFPSGRRLHVKQLCARTCPVLSVQRELHKSISSSDTYYSVQKHPQEYYKQETVTMFQQTLCHRKVLFCIFISRNKVNDHVLQNQYQ